MGKVLLVGSSISALPLALRIRGSGHELIVAGGVLQDPCHLVADKSLFVDYSDIEGLVDVTASLHLDSVVPSCNDTAFRVAAEIAAQHGLPGFDLVDTVDQLHIKTLFRSVCEQFGLVAPRATCNLFRGPHGASSPRGPLIVKPADSFSGRGVTVVGDERHLKEALDKARSISPSGRVVVEEFIEGSLHSHSAFIRASRIKADFFVDEFCTTVPFQVDCSNHPSALDEAVMNHVRCQVETLVRELNLVDGLMHTQFIAKGQEGYLIEVMRRCPGDLYGRLIELATGFDYTRWYLAPYLGEADPSATISAKRYMGRHTIASRQPMLFQGITGTAAGSLRELIPVARSGEAVQAAPAGKFAISFHEFASPREMIKETPRLSAQVEPTGPRLDATAPVRLVDAQLDMT